MSNFSQIFTILYNLISVSSSTINSQGDYCYLVQFLSNKNFKTGIFESNNVYNLYSEYKGNNNHNEIDIAFVGHMDVVDPGDKSLWKFDPFKLKEENEILYGRGAVDMKASIAAFIQAASDFTKINKNANIAIVITGDEETKSSGAKEFIKYTKQNNIKIKNILIGEPTSEKKVGDVIKNGRRGSANFDLIIHGIQGHVAYPDKSDNPILIANKIITSLNNLKLDNGNQNFQPSKLVITSIDTNNTTRNTIPENVKIKFNIRFNNEQNIEKLEKTLRNDIEKNIDISKYELSIISSSTSYLSPKSRLSEALVSSIKKITNINTNYTTGGGASDGIYLSKLAPVIEFGPLNETAHKINESISKKDLEILYKIYFETLVKFYS